MDSIIYKLGNLNSIEYINAKKIVLFIYSGFKYFVPYQNQNVKEIEKIKRTN